MRADLKLIIKKGQNVAKDDLKNNFLSIVQDNGEVLLDAFMKDGLWKDIPILGTCINVAKINANINNMMFLRKLYKFFFEASQLSENAKKKIKEKISSYSDKNLLGEEIIKVIDDSENDKKAILLGKAIRILTQNEISVDFYLSLVNKISRCYYADLLCIKDFETEASEYYSGNDKIPGVSLDQLYFCGFLNDTGYSGGGLENEPCGRSYQLNEYGIILRKMLLANN